MPTTSRRLGLSKYGKAPSLLKSLNRQGNNGQSSNSSSNDTSETASSDTKQIPIDQKLEEDDIYGPPLDSDDSDAENTRRTPQSSEEDEETGRGDILPTIFKAKKTTDNRPTHSAIEYGLSPIRDRLSAAANGNRAESPSLRRSRSSGSWSANNTLKKARTEISPMHKSKELDIFSIAPSSKPRTKTFKRYGSQSKSQGSRSSQSNGETSPEAVFKKPPELEFEMPTSPLKTFKLPGQAMPDVSEEEEGKTLKIFKIPGHTLDFSPHEESPFELATGLEELSPLELDAPDYRLDRMLDQALENGEDAPSQTPIFRMPLLPSQSATTIQAEVIELNNYEDNSFEKTPPSPEYTPDSACPMCGESVDALYLKRYNGGKRMNIRIQAKFCRAHKKRSARNEWAEKGYPVIDWINLDSRFAKHHSHLKSILDGAPSFYRNMLAELVKSGKDRTLLQAVKNSENTLTPGYYGSRGFRAMSENIMDEFASQLRRIAVTDRLVAARGVTGYVQFVLVPELAVRLICEDMSIGVEEGRQLMRETIALGDLLNEEVEDVVTWKEGDETL